MVCEPVSGGFLFCCSFLPAPGPAAGALLGREPPMAMVPSEAATLPSSPLVTVPLALLLPVRAEGFRGGRAVSSP